MTRQGTGYFLNENDRTKVDETIRRVGSPVFKQNQARNVSAAPPVRFGIVNEDWELGEQTVSVIPARFNDFGTNLSNTDAIDVYVQYHPGNVDYYPYYLDEFLAQDKVVPYIPFQGADGNGVSGIIAGEFVKQSLDPFGAQYVDDAGTPSVRLNGGEVYYDDNIGGTLVGGSSEVSLASNRYFFVEVTITTTTTGACTVTVAGAVQDSAAEPEYYDEISGVITLNIIVGWIDGTAKEFYQTHIGDIFLKWLYSPGFHLDYQRGANNKGVFAMVKSADSTPDGAAFSYFLEMNDYMIKFSAGNISEVEKGTDRKFGGVDEDSLYEPLDFSITSSTTPGNGSFTIQEKQLFYTFQSGLCQEFEDPNPANDVLTVYAGDNVNIDKDGFDNPIIEVQTTQITVVTAVQLDASNNLQIKTRTIEAIDPGSESAWTTVTGWATTNCP